MLKNNSKIYYNGSVWKTLNNGNITIIGQSLENKRYFLCQFEDKTIVEADYSAIKRGIVKNFNDNKESDIINLYKHSKYSQHDVADILEVSRGTVARILKKNNITRRIVIR